MSDITTIRTIISDIMRYDRAVFIGDNATVEFLVPNSPVYPNSQTVRVNAAIVNPNLYTIDNELGLIVFNTAPVDAADGVITYKFSILSDAQLQSLLDLEGDIRLAAADALDAIASSEALIQKRIKVLDIQTDGPATAYSLRKHAVMLREQVFSKEYTEAAFDIAEQINDNPGFREKIVKDWERDSG